MAYKLYKMTFKTAHFGTGTLDSSSLTFSADRLFSALSIEAIKLDKYLEFVNLAHSEHFVLSDSFPYNISPFIPKPIGYPLPEKWNQNQSILEIRSNSKKVKKLEFIDLDLLEDFMEGEIFENYDFAIHSLTTKNNSDDENGLYQVGVTTYNDQTSLYVIANQSVLFDELMMSLQFSGIGGKRSSGYGRFELEILDLPEILKNRLVQKSDKKVLLLTTALPVDKDLEKAMSGGKYLLTKSSGFTYSTSYNKNYKKQDLYKFKSGSTFDSSFEGDIYDVRPDGFEHEVLNFAKPLFYEMEE
ncbi:type III-A CRISPR-associated RAMP protein Csm4 [Streptococcus uberis]|uniref:type III-A CRISPR-associated RAMP protein Csm4 n=1 Tax=Streptococcus uberis TaxID=1349 RepID=UPI0027DE36B9|nr:type III-A CRISPR-associated RAMP protein Csm4 [Streptococcus uberis]MCK1241783.1 type III-A CRISPR-associated RAMP protein Csm4 [Streptococcus uberis]